MKVEITQFRKMVVDVKSLEEAEDMAYDMDWGEIDHDYKFDEIQY